VSELELREAATLVVLRDANSKAAPKLEVLLLRRRAGSAFAGGASVFPGGAVDRSDREPATASLSAGLDDREASRLLGVDSGGLGYFVAAIRECFEEAGLLFAGDSAGLVSFADPATRERYARHRGSLNGGGTTLAAICRSEGLLLAVDRFRYLSHWITPLGSPRRYDTRFFVAVVPENQHALHDDAEVVASEWVVPSEALARHHAGELSLMLPTVKHLEALSGCSNAQEFWDSAATEITAIEPRINVQGSVVRILLPGDAGFDAATGLPYRASSTRSIPSSGD
jgi:8-oxo-dGTP pyrophosphatase MutT (NUDIX family)